MDLLSELDAVLHRLCCSFAVSDILLRASCASALRGQWVDNAQGVPSSLASQIKSQLEAGSIQSLERVWRLKTERG